MFVGYAGYRRLIFCEEVKQEYRLDELDDIVLRIMSSAAND